MTAIPSGKISEGCITAILEKRQKTFTKEHFHGRQLCGEEVLGYVKKQKEKNAKIDPMIVMGIVDKFRQVHYTSKEENHRLAKLSKKDPNLQSNWEKMYKLAGIKLIDYVKFKRFDKYDLT
jgi:hypothetical protein